MATDAMQEKLNESLVIVEKGKVTSLKQDSLTELVSTLKKNIAMSANQE